MSPWIKIVLRLAVRHPGELAGVIGAAAVIAKAVGEDPQLAGYVAEATGMPVDQIPKLLADIAMVKL